MLERLRSILVSSFIGAITLGWVFAQAILHFAYVFSAPVAGWLTRREYHEMSNRVSTGFFLHDSLPELVKSGLLFLNRIRLAALALLRLISTSHSSN